MSKIDLEQMNKDLYPFVCYNKLKEIEETLNQLGKLNSTFTINKAELSKRMSIVLFEQLSKHLNRDENQDNYIKGLQNILIQKNKLITECRLALDAMEKELVFQEEALGFYENKYKDSL